MMYIQVKLLFEWVMIKKINVWQDLILSIGNWMDRYLLIAALSCDYAVVSFD